ncbi:MAG: hypothetical protein HOH64_17515, partial [Rhodospirillales bacterium]|nr:hypothetical protein [Rhodospirillales bacterium]
SPTTPSSSPPPKPSSGGGNTLTGAFIAILVFGIVGAGAWVSRDQWWTYVAPIFPQTENSQQGDMVARVNAIEESIADHGGASHNSEGDDASFAALEQERDELSSKLAIVMIRLEAMEEALAGVERMANAVKVDDATLAAQDSLRALSDRLNVLESTNITGTTDATDSAASAQLDNMLTRLQTVEDQTRALESRPLESAMSSDRAAAFILSVGQLRDVVRRGAPYEQALEALSSTLAPTLDADDLDNVAAPMQALRDHAASGVPTLLQLQQSFGPVADAAFDAGGPELDDSWVAETLHQIKSIIRIRNTDASAKPGSVESSIARAANDISAGDLAGAVQVLSDLDGDAAAALQGWMSSARARLAVDDAVGYLHTLAIDQMMTSTLPAGQG